MEGKPTEQFIKSDEDTTTLKANETKLSKCIRVLIFIVFWFTMLFVCSDGGVPAASSNFIKRDLQFNNLQFGQYTSVVQIGRITGNLLMIVLLKIGNRKYCLIIDLIFKASSFLIYFFTSNWWIIGGVRFIQGLSHMFPYVYIPTWCDQFGMLRWKTMIMSIIQTASPFGSVFGFSVTTFIGAENWRWGFAILSFLLYFLTFIIAVIPERYFSARVHHQQFNHSTQLSSSTKRSQSSIFEIASNETMMKKHASALASASTSSSAKMNAGFSQLFSPIFIFITLSRTVLMFIFMGVHSWIGDYFVNVLKIDNKLQTTFSYSMISLGGPSLGSLIGGAICQFIGGYDKKESIFVAIGFSILTCICGVFVPLMNTLFTFSLLLFGFFFFANGMMPILIGITFNSVSHDLKGAFYSINTLACTFMGNLISPPIYGYLNDKFKETDKKMPMRCILNYVWANLVYLIITAFFRYRISSEDAERDIGNKEGRISKTKAVGDTMNVSTGQEVNVITIKDDCLTSQNQKPEPKTHNIV